MTVPASDLAWAGLGWASINRTLAPAAIAAFARVGMNSRCPPEEVPRPPGSWTEWVASKQTGKPKDCMMGMARMSLTRLL